MPKTPSKSQRNKTKRRLDFDEEQTSQSRDASAASPPKRQRRTIEPFTTTSSPLARLRDVGAAVTPEDESQPLSSYIPKYIHQNLDYHRRGESNLSETTQKVFALIESNFNIPSDFEQKRSYGPLSGSSYEERVIQAYSLGKLKAKKDDIPICTCCGTIGHKRFDCSTLI